MDGLLAEQSEFRFLEDKTILFSSICRFFTMTTVFIALKIDFIATKTVVILHDHGNPRQRRRSSWKSSAQLMAERPEKIGGVNGTRPDFVRKYSILRKLSFTTLSRFSSYSDKTGPISGWHAEHLRYSVTPKPERREKCQFKTNRNFNWNRKMAKKGLLYLENQHKHLIAIIQYTKNREFFRRNMYSWRKRQEINWNLVQRSCMRNTMIEDSRISQFKKIIN